MATKTLTITENAYNSLKSHKIGEESFSQTILRVTNEKKGAAAALFGSLKLGQEKTNTRTRMRDFRASFNANLSQKIVQHRKRNDYT